MAATQFGVVTRKQLLGFGVGSNAVDRLLRRSNLTRLHAGVYMFDGFVPAEDSRLMSLILRAGKGAVATARTAAKVWGLPAEHPARPQILVPRSRRGIQLPDAEIHTTTRADRQDATVEADIPVTSLARTLIELAACDVDDSQLVAAIVQALRQGILVTARLRRRAQDLRRPGRRGPERILGILDDLDPAAIRRESSLEDDLSRVLCLRGLPLPVYQLPVHTPGGWARIDAAYPDLKLGIEADGYVWHSTPEQLRRDRSRKNRLQLLDWSMLHYTHLDFAARPSEVAGEIEQLYMRRRRALAVHA